MIAKQRVRSPRYPSFSLREAEALARKIFEKDGMNPVDRESAVQHLGYSSLNGASATALASLKQFGLVVDAGKGMLKLTDTALDLIEPESDEGRIAALQAAAFSPDLFAALRERFPGTAPSESNLRAHLLRNEFTSAAVKSIVPAYLDTCEYLASSKVIERTSVPDRSAARPASTEVREEQPMAETLSTISQVPAQHATGSTNRRMIFDTQEGEVVFTFPDGLSEDSLEEVEAWLALVAKRLRRTVKH